VWLLALTVLGQMQSVWMFVVNRDQIKLSGTSEYIFIVPRTYKIPVINILK
jgi:hypothetical protein